MLQLDMNMMKIQEGGGKNIIKQSIIVPAHSVHYALMAVASLNAVRGNQPKITRPALLKSPLFIGQGHNMS